MDRDQYAAELADEVPTERDELLVAAAVVRELHAVVITCGTMVERAAQRYRDLYQEAERGDVIREFR